jgi:hypothetical protein
MLSEYFVIDKKPHNLLRRTTIDEEINRLPAPPKDLPSPWRGDVWRRWFFGLFLFVIFIIILGRIQFPQFASIWMVVFGCFMGLWTALGLVLFIIYAQRPMIVNRNQSHLRIVNKYKRKQVSEGLFPPRVKFVINGKGYFLYFYVPGTSGPNVFTLAKGSEPLLFDTDLHWVDDESLFHKSALLWAYMLEFSPQTIGNNRIYQYNMLRRSFLQHYSQLPLLLRQNHDAIVKKGVEKEYNLIISSIPSKAAYYRAILDKDLTMIAWGDAYGWDSTTELCFEHISLLHESQITFRSDILKFYKNHRVHEAENAASKLIQVIKESGPLGWWLKNRLLQALQCFADTYNPPPEPIEKVQGEWQAPDLFLEGYRARIAWANEADERMKKAG